MRRWMTVLVAMTLAGAALAATSGGDRPVFVGWMDRGKSLDRAILTYWERVAAGDASPEELVDLGTMLFRRGFPKDAIRMFRRAAKAAGPGRTAAEAWFRAGLVHHKLGQLRRARRAYRKAIRRFPGHGWCNFYLGLVEERLGHVRAAVHYYERAYRFAPALADPRVNPDVLYSRLQTGVVVRHERRRALALRMPLEPLEPERVAAAREGRTLPGKAAEPPARLAAPAVRPRPGSRVPVGIHPGGRSPRPTPVPGGGR